MVGVPIRLIRKDGGVINLDCTDYMMSITRSIITVPIPITAERFGADLNMVQAEIRMECIVVDDDCTTIDYGVSYAASTIDFSYRDLKTDDDDTAHSPWLSGDGGSATVAQLGGTINPAYFLLTSTDGTEFKITLKNASVVDDGITGNDIEVDIRSADTAITMVTAITTALASHTDFIAKFSVVAGVGVNEQVSTTQNTKIVFTQKVGGSDGATDTPTLNSGTHTHEVHISPFNYVEDTGCRSAGDKIQNMLATVSNNSVLGAMGKIGQFGSSGGGFKGLTLQGEASIVGTNKSDYIVGLQLPYNSLAQASLSNVGDPVGGYNVRNFLIVTGGNMAANLKDASANILDATAQDFVFLDKYTGISGTIKVCEVKYDAGDTIFRATITFQPLDFVMGIG